MQKPLWLVIGCLGGGAGVQYTTNQKILRQTWRCTVCADAYMDGLDVYYEKIGNSSMFVFFTTLIGTKNLLVGPREPSCCSCQPMRTDMWACMGMDNLFLSTTKSGEGFDWSNCTRHDLFPVGKTLGKCRLSWPPVSFGLEFFFLCFLMVFGRLRFCIRYAKGVINFLSLQVR